MSHREHDSEDIRLLLQAIAALATTILELENRLMAKFDDLVAEVSKVKTVEASAVTAFQGVISRLQNMLAAPTSDQIQVLIDDLNNSSNALASAVASVPADPTPAPAPTPADPAPATATDPAPAPATPTP